MFGKLHKVILKIVLWQSSLGNGIISKFELNAVPAGSQFNGYL
mgnify:CR=1